MKEIEIFKVSRDRLTLLSMIIVAILFHLLWLTGDRSQPAWDQAAHLTNVLNIQKVINHFQIFSSAWWHELWAQVPSYRAPFLYILTVPFFNIFGKGFHSGILVNLLFIPVIACAVYFLGKRGFDRQVGLWAAGLSLMFPALLAFQLDYLLDYGIVGMTMLSFVMLTLWRDAKNQDKSWQWSLLFGIVFGCLMLTKPTGFLFLFVPGLWLLGSFIKHRHWVGLVQSGLVLIIPWSIFGGWFSQNWLTIITSAIAANGMGVGEGDPSGSTLAGWLYYFQLAPELISFPILIPAIGCTVLAVFKNQLDLKLMRSPQVFWLILYLVGAYAFCSLATNKDGRFISPILPILSIFIAASLNLFQTVWWRRLKWFAVGLNVLLLAIHIFQIPGTEAIAKITKAGYSYPPMSQPQPELSGENLIQAIVDNQPYLRANIGSLASTKEINFENLDFYGQTHNFQVYAREFSGSFNEKQLIDRDLKALNWYAVKMGQFAHVNKLIPIIEGDSDLQLHQMWTTRDGIPLKLYRRKNIPISVAPLREKIEPVRIEKVIIAPSTGSSIQTTYQVSGDRELLKHGLLLLDWQTKDQKWHHDRAIGLGQLYLDSTNIPSFRITEHSAMLPPSRSPLNEYLLTATYLDRQTGKSFPLTVPKIEIKPITNQQFQLDLITQLRQLGNLFAQGKIDPVFSEIAILNQYDPIQDYLVQAQQAIEYRIAQGDPNLELKYTLALTQALQRQIEPLLNNLTQITQQDLQNPAAWTYLGVVRLYNWQPQAAEMVFKKADELPAPPPALRTLKIVSALFRGDLPQLWERLK